MTIEMIWRPFVRVAVGTLLLLLVPLLAMRFTAEVNWTPIDFVVAGIMLFGAGIAYEVVAGKAGHAAWRAAVAMAVLATLLLVWVNLAVGLIGSENNPANGMYVAVVGVGIIGAAIARRRPRGMAVTLGAMACVQIVVGVIAIGLGLGEPWNGPLQLVLLNGFFAALFVGSAWLFWRSASASAIA